MINVNKWEKIKKENQFFIPNYNFLFQEFLDIFSIFIPKKGFILL